MISRVIAFFDYLHDLAFHLLLMMPLSFAALLLGIYVVAPDVFFGSLYWVLVILPFVAAPSLIVTALITWRSYVRSLWRFKRNMILLEVRIPRDSMKSPKAMAVVFNGIVSGPWEGTFINRWWVGKVRPQFSFELVSIEGNLRFYIHLQDVLKDYLTANIYGQFPDAEITEVEDYTSGIRYDPDKMGMLAIEYKKSKPDPYPIKTYVDYGVDKDQTKLEQRVDPLASVFEFFSNLGPGEEMWLQMVIRRNRSWSIGFGPLKIGYDWHGGAQKQIDSIYESLVEEEIAPGVKAKGKAKLTPSQEEEVQALARTLHAEGIDVGIRLLYLARKDAYKPQMRAAPGLVKLWREFKTPNLNAIVPNGNHGFPMFDYPWQFENIRTHWQNANLLDAYRRRNFFYAPHIHKYMIMSPEELATIYHYPSYEVRTPGLQRVESRKGGAPPNLPI